MVLGSLRFYLPGIGRFLTRDPIGHDGGLNLYAYCSNNPVGNIDPTGHAPDWLNWNSVSNYAAGIGDTISGSMSSMFSNHFSPMYNPFVDALFGQTSYTQRIRQIFGYDGNVDFESSSYSWGKGSGYAWEFATSFIGGGAGFQKAGGEMMTVMVGKGAPSHVMYQIGETVFHGQGPRGSMRVEAFTAEEFSRMGSMGFWKPYFSFRVPIANAGLASGSGMTVKNCVNAATRAILRGWGF